MRQQLLLQARSEYLIKLNEVTPDQSRGRLPKTGKNEFLYKFRGGNLVYQPAE